MINLIDKLSSVEEKVKNLLNKKNQLEEENINLKDKLQQQLNSIRNLEKTLEELQKENQNLRAANALLGSKEFKRETKFKINSLIREIDHCISQLSE